MAQQLSDRLLRLDDVWAYGGKNTVLHDLAEHAASIESERDAALALAARLREERDEARAHLWGFLDAGNFEEMQHAEVSARAFLARAALGER